MLKTAQRGKSMKNNGVHKKGYLEWEIQSTMKRVILRSKERVECWWWDLRKRYISEDNKLLANNLSDWAIGNWKSTQTVIIIAC